MYSKEIHGKTPPFFCKEVNQDLLLVLRDLMEFSSGKFNNSPV